MKDISYIVTQAVRAWEHYRQGNKAEAYKHYAQIDESAREAMAICAGPEKLPSGWPYFQPVTLCGLHPPPLPVDKASCVGAAYERRAMAEGRVDKPEYPENRIEHICLVCGLPNCGWCD